MSNVSPENTEESLQQFGGYAKGLNRRHATAKLPAAWCISLKPHTVALPAAVVLLAVCAAAACLELTDAQEVVCSDALL